MAPDLFDRRSFLKIGSVSVFGSLAWGEIARLRAQAAERPKKEISVIHVMLSGGMSHMDTLDMKPDVRPAFRSVFKPIETNVSGIQICDRLPLLAMQADKYTIIRSATHKLSVHERASYLVYSGHEPLATVNYPSMGSVATYFGVGQPGVPPYVVLPDVPGYSQSLR